MYKKSDEELIAMFQSGDATAFNDIFKKYKGPIFNFLLSKCKNRDLASDLTQDVFTKIINKAGTFQHQSKFSTWIYTIARNTFMDWARKAKHRNHSSLDQPGAQDSSQPLVERIADSKHDPDRDNESKNLQEALSQAIDKLPDNQKEVFILREYHGVSFDEIANIVDAKTGTVKSRMRYALESLRLELCTYEEYARKLS